MKKAIVIFISIFCSAVSALEIECDMKSRYENVYKYKYPKHLKLKPIKVAVIDTYFNHSVCDKSIKNISLYSGEKKIQVNSENLDKLKYHGTNVVSIIKAINPKARITLYQTHFLSSYNLAFLIKKAVDDGANIINYSITGGEYMAMEKKAIEYAIKKNVLVIGSAGNEGVNVEKSPIFPGSYKLDGMISVTGHEGTYNYSDKVIDFALPSKYIPIPSYSDQFFLTGSGTSYASAVLSGLSSILLGAKNFKTPLLLKEYLKTFARYQMSKPLSRFGTIDPFKIINELNEKRKLASSQN
ncbi:MAG: S8 family serine peptidase [Oligoflexia bacterium]|nr:S8 family serine peptidase [Oligoflexia bacterium]